MEEKIEELIIPACDILAVVRKDGKLQFPNEFPTQQMPDIYRGIIEYLKGCSIETFVMFSLAHVLFSREISEAIRERSQIEKKTL